MLLWMAAKSPISLLVGQPDHDSLPSGLLSIEPAIYGCFPGERFSELVCACRSGPTCRPWLREPNRMVYFSLFEPMTCVIGRGCATRRPSQADEQPYGAPGEAVGHLEGGRRSGRRNWAPRLLPGIPWFWRPSKRNARIRFAGVYGEVFSQAQEQWLTWRRLGKPCLRPRSFWMPGTPPSMEPSIASLGIIFMPAALPDRMMLAPAFCSDHLGDDEVPFTTFT